MKKIKLKEIDYKLDIIRGLSIVYVLFIHTIYNQDFLSGGLIELIKSLFLFEMPLFFFITGASTMYENIDNIWEYYKKKFKRIMIPYYIYAVIIVILNFIYYKSACQAFSIFEWIVPFISKKTFSIYFTEILWFVFTYLLVILFLPYLKRYFIKKRQENNKEIYLPIFYILLYFIFKGFTNFELTNNSTFELYFNNILCYILFSYIGFFWQDIKNLEMSKKIKALIPELLMLLITVILTLSSYFTLDMQIDKFPPNIIFIVYSMGILCLLYILKGVIIKIITWACKNKIFKFIFSPFKNYSLTVYFFHTFGLYIVHALMCKYYFNIGNEYIIAIINFILLVIISSFLGRIFCFIEKISLSKKYDRSLIERKKKNERKNS